MLTTVAKKCYQAASDVTRCGYWCYQSDNTENIKWCCQLQQGMVPGAASGCYQVQQVRWPGAASNVTIQVQQVVLPGAASGSYQVQQVMLPFRCSTWWYRVQQVGCYQVQQVVRPGAASNVTNQVPQVMPPGAASGCYQVQQVVRPGAASDGTGCSKWLLPWVQQVEWPGSWQVIWSGAASNVTIQVHAASDGTGTVYMNLCYQVQLYRISSYLSSILHQKLKLNKSVRNFKGARVGVGIYTNML
jgi:hypothetical protein